MIDYSNFVTFQPPICENGINLIRRKRDTVVYDERDNVYDIDEKPQTINVYSGLYVNEAEDLDEDASLNDNLVDVVSDILQLR